MIDEDEGKQTKTVLSYLYLVQFPLNNVYIIITMLLVQEFRDFVSQKHTELQTHQLKRT